MIHWITESLGTAAWGEVETSPGCRILDVRDLVDKGGNAPEVIKFKIDQALDCLRRGQKVVVCCDYGMSRSNAIAAGILAAQRAVTLDSAIRHVVAATGETSIKIQVLSGVRQALGGERQERAASAGGERRLLVTGASGFIGSSLLDALRRKYEVAAPLRQEIDLLRDTVALDLLARERRVDTVLHLAYPRVYTSNESLGTSLIMLKNVLDVCAENGLFLVYVSSWEIYSGYQAQELKADETLAPCPGGTYGQARVLGETLLRHFHCHYGVPYTLLRSSPVYGPGGERPKFIWNFLEKAQRNEEIVVHRYLNGLPSLDLLYVDDLGAAILAAIECPVQGEINLGTGIGTSTTEIAQRIVQSLGSPSGIRQHEISGHVGNIVMDNRHALNTLGWRPKVGIAQGLENMVGAGLARSSRVGAPSGA